MLEGAEDRVGRKQEVIHQNSLFYADNDVVASLYPRCLQGYFNTLVSLFDRVGLRTNLGKTVGMVCHPFQAAGIQSEAAYGRRMTGEGTLYQERQRGRVHCKECGEKMDIGSLVGQMQTQHGRSAKGRWSWSATSIVG